MALRSFTLIMKPGSDDDDDDEDDDVEEDGDLLLVIRRRRVKPFRIKPLSIMRSLVRDGEHSLPCFHCQYRDK